SPPRTAITARLPRSWRGRGRPRVIYDPKVGGTFDRRAAGNGRIASQEPRPALAPPARGERPRSARAGARDRNLRVFTVGTREQQRGSVAATAAASREPLPAPHHRSLGRAGGRPGPRRAARQAGDRAGLGYERCRR